MSGVLSRLAARAVGAAAPARPRPVHRFESAGAANADAEGGGPDPAGPPQVSPSAAAPAARERLVAPSTTPTARPLDTPAPIAPAPVVAPPAIGAPAAASPPEPASPGPLGVSASAEAPSGAEPPVLRAELPSVDDHAAPPTPAAAGLERPQALLPERPEAPPPSLAAPAEAASPGDRAARRAAAAAPPPPVVEITIGRLEIRAGPDAAPAPAPPKPRRENLVPLDAYLAGRAGPRGA